MACTYYPGLQVEDLHDTVASKDVVTAFNALLESQAFQQLNQPGKWNVGICVASENLVKQLPCI